MCFDNQPQSYDQAVQQSQDASTGNGPVGNTFIDYLRDSLRMMSPSAQQASANARGMGGFTPSQSPNNLGKASQAAGLASQAGLCGGGAGAAAGAF